MKFQIILPEQLFQCRPVKRILIQNSKFTFKISYIRDHFLGLRLINGKFIFIHSELPDQLHKRLHRKGIVLHGNTEFLFLRSSPDKAILDQLILLQKLPGITEKFLPLRRRNHSLAGTPKNLKTNLILKFPDRAGKIRLRYKKHLCRLIHRTALRRCRYVSEL